MNEIDAVEAVQAAAALAYGSTAALAAASTEQTDAAILAMARLLPEASDAVLAANRADYDAAVGNLGAGLLDRLRLDEARLADMAGQLHQLAGTPPEPSRRQVRTLDRDRTGDLVGDPAGGRAGDAVGDLVVEEWRRPIGVIGANFEARPNVVIDIASQLIKSHNAGVLRTGSAAIRSAIALVDHVVAPALHEAGLPRDAIQLIRIAGRDTADALVRQPKQIPLVILRGSGDSTRNLAEKAALAGVKTLAHADGGGVMYVHPSADRTLLASLLNASLDRLGVCNRLNLLLIDTAIWDDILPSIMEQLAAHEPKITASLPPHEHPIGYEWALDSGREATVTIARVDDLDDAVQLANEQTSGLAAAIVAEDERSARRFLTAYAGTGGFWNAPTRLLDGFKLLAVPETGINIDKVPGPRGPVTFRDLYLRQYVVLPANRLGA